MDKETSTPKAGEGPRRTQGEGVPELRRKGPDKAGDAADPQRGREEGLPRRSDGKPTARDRDGL